MKTYLSEGLKKIASKKSEHEFVIRSLAPRTHIISNLKKLKAEKVIINLFSLFKDNLT